MTQSFPTGPGSLALIGIGPGDLSYMTAAASAALQAAEVIIGYQIYLDLAGPLFAAGQQIISSGLGSELERARQAVSLAAKGQRVALISSGDIGIYAMASPVFEILADWPEPLPDVEVFPGISAVQAVAARLGAPLGHDFCTISLSDLLTPWPVIERRIQAAAWSDFVVAFYNPRSKKRDWQLSRAREILLSHRADQTPAAVVRNVTRPDETIQLTTLGQLEPSSVDMFSLVLIGNSQSYRIGEWLVTPRGYTVQEAEPALKRAPKRAHNETTVLTEIKPARVSGVDHYPVTLTHMAGKPVVVVGGGPVGERKVRGLLNSGAQVTLISPEVTSQLQVWADAGRIAWQARSYQAGDLAGAELAFAATNQRVVNAAIAAEAKALGLLCNIADKPEEGNFHVPAMHRQAGITVAVSTAGQSPGLARKVRDSIAGTMSNDE